MEDEKVAVGGGVVVFSCLKFLDDFGECVNDGVAGGPDAIELELGLFPLFHIDPVIESVLFWGGVCGVALGDDCGGMEVVFFAGIGDECGEFCLEKLFDCCLIVVSACLFERFKPALVVEEEPGIELDCLELLVGFVEFSDEIEAGADVVWLKCNLLEQDGAWLVVLCGEFEPVEEFGWGVEGFWSALEFGMFVFPVDDGGEMVWREGVEVGILVGALVEVEDDDGGVVVEVVDDLGVVEVLPDIGLVWVGVVGGEDDGGRALVTVPEEVGDGLGGEVGEWWGVWGEGCGKEGGDQEGEHGLIFVEMLGLGR